MASLPSIKDFSFDGKKVLVRGDLDVNPQKSDEMLRLESIIPTLQLLFEKGAEITIIGHRGRPEGKENPELSLKPVEESLRKIIPDIKFQMLENLRFNPGEESNDLEYAKNLSKGYDFYVNEAFSVSHRNHTSIVTLPTLLPHAVGLRFYDEVENLSKIFENPERPVVSIISGVKRDKLEMIPQLEKICDKVLVGGRLPDYLQADKSVRSYTSKDKVIVANLVMDKEDITIHSIERFKSEIREAKTILLAGALGKYEDPGHMQGSKEIFEEVARSSAFKIVGGGDSLVLVSNLGIKDKFDWVSVGGGAILEFVTKKSLCGIDALMGA